MSAAQIHLARLDDLAAIAACVRDAYGHYVARLGREPAPMLADYAALIRTAQVYVLRESVDGALRGVIVMQPDNEAMHVENVAVRPEHQRQGLGRLLLEFAEQQALARGLPEVRLYTNELMTENIAYYRRLGYQEVDRRTEHGFRRVFLRKPLDQHSASPPREP